MVKSSRKEENGVEGLLTEVLYEQDHILATLNDFDYPRNLFQLSTYGVGRNSLKANEQS